MDSEVHMRFNFFYNLKSLFFLKWKIILFHTVISVILYKLPLVIKIVPENPMFIKSKIPEVVWLFQWN